MCIYAYIYLFIGIVIAFIAMYAETKASSGSVVETLLFALYCGFWWPVYLVVQLYRAIEDRKDR